VTEETGGFLFAAVRRLENMNALKRKKQSPSPVSVESATPSTSPEATLKQELEALAKKNEEKLQTPQAQVKPSLSKLAIFGIVLGFLIMGFLFFIGGFMLCYSFFPPYQASSLAAEESPSQSPAEGGSNESYAVRQKALAVGDEGGGDNKGALLGKIEAQSASRAKSMTHDTIIRRTSLLNTKIKQLLGWRIGSVIEPATLGIAEALSGKIESKIMAPKSGSAKESTLSAASTQSSGTAPSSGHPGSTIVQGHGEATGSSAQENIYSIEVRVFNDSDVAYSLQQELKQRGMEAYIVRYTVQDTLHYSVRFGGFKSFKIAQETMGVFRAVWDQPARVVIIDKNEDRMGP